MTEPAEEIPRSSFESKAETIYDGVRTSLPRLDIFDPSVFDIRTVVGMLLLFGSISYFAYRIFMLKVVRTDDFICDLGISYSEFELPDEVDEYYEKKEALSGDMKNLKNQLLKRAVADIPIILRMQKEGPGIHTLYKQALIGETEYQGFLKAEQIISEEIEFVQTEAEEIEPGLGSKIWRMAGELRQAYIVRKHQMEMQKNQVSE